MSMLSPVYIHVYMTQGKLNSDLEEWDRTQPDNLVQLCVRLLSASLQILSAISYRKPFSEGIKCP